MNHPRKAPHGSADSCRRIRDIGGLSALTALIGEDEVARGEDGCVEPFVEPEVPRAVLNHYTLRFLEGTVRIRSPVGEIVDVSELLIVET